MLISARGMPRHACDAAVFSHFMRRRSDPLPTSVTLRSPSAPIATPYIKTVASAHVIVADNIARNTVRLGPTKIKGAASAAGNAQRYGNHIPIAPAKARPAARAFQRDVDLRSSVYHEVEAED